MLDTETGEIVRRRLEQEKGEARAFYAALPKPSLIGIEATSFTQWFERMAGEQGHQLWVVDMFGSFPGSLGRTTNQVYRCEGADAVMGSKERDNLACGASRGLRHLPSPLPLSRPYGRGVPEAG
jgi:hypothetical protein